MKRKSFLVVVSILLAVVMMISGCGSKTEGSKDSPSAAGNPANASGQDGKLTGNLEIQYFVGGYGDAWWKYVIEEFQKENPDLKITQFAGPKVNEQLKPRWISNTPPDVIYIDGPDSTMLKAQMVKEGQLLDLGDWMNTEKVADGTLLKDKFLGAPQKYDDGKEYTVPLIFGYYGTWYSANLFKDKGWEVPKNWNAFTDNLKKAKAAGMEGYIHQGQYPYYIQNGLLFSGFSHFGGIQTMEDFNSMKSGVYLSEPVQTTMKKLQELRDQGLIAKKALGLNHTASEMEWLQDKAALLPCGLWLPNEMSEATPAGFEYGLVPSVWQNDGEKYEIISYLQDVGIAKHAKNPEAAKAFIKFLYQDKHAIEFAKKTGALLNYKVDLASAEGVQNSTKQASAYLADTNAVNIIQPNSIMTPDMVKELDNATTAFLAGDIDAQKWGARLEKAAGDLRGN